MAGFLSSLGFSVLTVTLSFGVLAAVVSPPQIERTAPFAGKFGALVISRTYLLVIWDYLVQSSRSADLDCRKFCAMHNMIPVQLHTTADGLAMRYGETAEDQIASYGCME